MSAETSIKTGLRISINNLFLPISGMQFQGKGRIKTAPFSTMQQPRIFGIK